VDISSCLLEGMSNVAAGTFVMAATNYPSEIDAAFDRRFNIKILITLPTKEDRLKMLILFHEKRKSNIFSNLLKHDFEWLANQTKGYSGDDLFQFMQELFEKPFENVRKSKYFRPSESHPGKWIPCTEKNDNVIKVNWESIMKNVILPPITIQDVVNTLKCKKATRPQNGMIDKLNEYCDAYGLNKEIID
jgi:SpoVK/Ycf46/Vps4 family AAA+-type ATPase